MKKYLIFDLDGTLIESQNDLMKIVLNHLVEKFQIEEEKVKYYFSTTRGTGLSLQLENILNLSKEDAKKEAQVIYKKINKNCEKGNFFPGVIDKIKELSKDYKLFLSTGNSTKFAEENLKKGNIYDCFDYILGSDIIPKSIGHIDFLKELSMDKDFEKFSIFIGDGEADREIAKNSCIDFIHIDEKLENKYQDKYEIKSVALISNILDSNI